MTDPRILHVVGARPNFMKAAPLIAVLGNAAGVRQALVHTGQHYDANMSDAFFRQLGLPHPDVNLGVGSGSHARQTAEVMVGLDQYLDEQPADLVVVYGDVNSTMAASLVAAKRRVRLAHVEAGLRSGDRSMPEETNRLVTDRLADLLFTPSEDAVENLLREGTPHDSIHDVGNIMIDSLVRLLPRTDLACARELAGIPGEMPYVLVTLHRPSNVDDPSQLVGIVGVLRELSERLAVVFPVHPRTRARLQSTGADLRGIRLCEPLGYLEFLALQQHASLVITDSGGIQEETTYLGVQCLTVRDTTERPVTVTLGTNRLIGTDPARLRVEAGRVLDGERKQGVIPPRWDGRTAERIADVLLSRA
ncbi:MAG TPA: UDP-N-acetylglucosamine 2-epimerase (non-hydrolyzing) [Gemmatimonadaceae bacterium]|nr:UDP-N-acetylglucosamine 2-epimerase (non-hydrolyzing) [Gemmatimonadaceae bacterium]